MYFTNYHKTNHNVENYRGKRKEDHVPTIYEVTTEHIKIKIHVKYSRHIYGDIGHKIIDCLKYNDMQNMFTNKGVKTTRKPFVVEPEAANPLVHIMDVNMTITKSKVIEEQMFKDKEIIIKNICY
jgi:hypothetical protein